MTKYDLISAAQLPMFRVATWAYRHFRLSQSPRQGLRILMYHAIGTPIDGDVRCLYNMNFRNFEKHMRHLAQHYRDQLVPLDASALKGNSLQISVTFDDGYRDNLTTAAPLMVELGIPFTIFVCTGAVAQQKTGFLSEADVRELAGLPGATIGSHSVNHRRLSECDDRGLKEELAASRAYLEDLLGRSVQTLSYPHGAVSHRVRDMAENMGYQIGATSRFDINRPDRDFLLLCRTLIAADDDVSILEQKLCGDWDWNRWRSADPVVGV